MSQRTIHNGLDIKMTDDPNGPEADYFQYCKAQALKEITEDTNKNLEKAKIVFTQLITKSPALKRRTEKASANLEEKYGVIHGTPLIIENANTRDKLIEAMNTIMSELPSPAPSPNANRKNEVIDDELKKFLEKDPPKKSPTERHRTLTRSQNS
jgi:hypothetical protein